MDLLMEEGETKEFKITVRCPEKCTEKEFTEWVEFHMGYSAGLSLSNPLSEHEAEAEDFEEY